MKIHYSPKWTAWPDSAVEERLLGWAEEEAQGFEVDIYISTENVLQCARALVAEDKIASVTLIYGDKEWTVNKYGALGNWTTDETGRMQPDFPPDEVEGWGANWAIRTLQAGLKKRKAERQAH